MDPHHMLLQRIVGDSTRTFVTIGFGALLGQYFQTCGGPHDYHLAGLSVGWRQEKPGRTLSAEGQLFGGADRSPSFSGSPDVSHDAVLPIRGGAVRVGADFRYVGAEVGLAGGTLVEDGHPPQSPQPWLGYNLPILGMRLGPPEFFLFGTFGDNEIGFTPADVINLGVGFPLDSGRTVVRLGASDLGFFVKTRIGLHNGVTITPMAVYGGRHHSSTGLKAEYAIPIGSHR